jgi:uncharacterized protein with NAD-binding domain and iron-sulfur cluster
LHYYEDSLLEQPDRNLIIQSVTELQRAFPEIRGNFVHATVRRNSKVHSQFRVPTKESLHVKTAWDNVYACGDWIGYDTPSMWMERSTTTAIAAANAVLAHYGKETYPILQPPQPEILVRIISAVMRFARMLLAPVISWIVRSTRRR